MLAVAGAALRALRLTLSRQEPHRAIAAITSGDHDISSRSSPRNSRNTGVSHADSSAQDTRRAPASLLRRSSPYLYQHVLTLVFASMASHWTVLGRTCRLIRRS